MSNATLYTVVIDGSLDAFAGKVAAQLDAGWALAGGVTVDKDCNGLSFYLQAMTKRVDVEKPPSWEAAARASFETPGEPSKAALPEVRIEIVRDSIRGWGGERNVRFHFPDGTSILEADLPSEKSDAEACERLLVALESCGILKIIKR